MSEQQLEELGPIDYLVMEWSGDQPVTGEALAHIIDLSDRGIIRVLDIAFLAKDVDGTVSALDLAEVGDAAADFEGASSGLLGQSDLEEAAAVLEPNTVAGVLVWENTWAAPVAAALRRSGGQLVATGRIPVQDIIASLDATEAVH